MARKKALPPPPPSPEQEEEVQEADEEMSDEEMSDEEMSEEESEEGELDDDEEMSLEESEDGEQEESVVEENEETNPIKHCQVNQKLGVQKQAKSPPPASQTSSSEEGSGSEEEEEEESDFPPSSNVSVVTVKESEIDDSVMDDMSDDVGDFQSKYPYLTESFDVDWSNLFPPCVISTLKKGLELIDCVKAREWEEKWKEIRLQEAKLLLKRIELIKKQTELVLNAWKEERNGNEISGVP